MFSAPKYSALLDKRREEHGIAKMFKTDLIEVQGEKKIAIFKNNESGDVIEKKFDLLHVVPFQGPPLELKNSPLVNEKGMIDVNQHTM